MGYLDNASITVDAVLTKKGREILSRGGNLDIGSFTLSDTGVDYTLWNTDHPSGSAFYGEAIEKTFQPPIRVYALVSWEGIETSNHDARGLDKTSSISVHFHKRRLTEDQDLFVREGDFVLYGDIYYEIMSLSEPRQLFGQINHRFEITAKCVRAREGLFDGS